MNKLKRGLSALLVLLMCISLFPVSAFAEEEVDVTDEVAANEEIIDNDVIPEVVAEAETEPAEETDPVDAVDPAAPAEGSVPAVEEAGNEDEQITTQDLDNPNENGKITTQDNEEEPAGYSRDNPIQIYVEDFPRQITIPAGETVWLNFYPVYDGIFTISDDGVPLRTVLYDPWENESSDSLTPENNYTTSWYLYSFQNNFIALTNDGDSDITPTFYVSFEYEDPYYEGFDAWAEEDIVSVNPGGFARMAVGFSSSDPDAVRFAWYDADNNLLQEGNSCAYVLKNVQHNNHTIPAS